ncbi:hypothetical protein PV413_03430 [Streptomyces scabiei]|uniref:hypothetical protein n=1 Tax=Streptomyces scabiei TaxID=1930 RepID=UPI001B311DC8|nr:MULTISPECIES: hypothetical protein [Streptomyces]MDX2749607.1 hypothetical protein [Streptomyces scabiei]MDX3146525.1 hypothetical protein [Streptomyces scabiei]MDX3196931.1 hypothetical protein [Streptomyces scabiei]QTU45925.1 hypothetical protein F3K20_14555 [Streptomyces sp. LBUM 1482]
MPTHQTVDALLDAYAERGRILARVQALAEAVLNSPRSDPERRQARGFAHQVSVAIRPTTHERPCAFDMHHNAHTYPYGPGESACYCPGLPERS